MARRPMATACAPSSSQAVPAQPRVERGLDARAAVAGYANYQQSYVTPAAQDNASAFGNK